MKSTSITFLAVVIALFGSATTAEAQQGDLASLDTDGDSKVTVAEFEEYASSKLAGFDRIEDFAKAVDADSNGEISESEFASRMDALQKMARSDAEADEKGKEKSKDDGSKKASKATDAAKSTFEKMKKLIAKNEWEKAAKLMTSTASDDVVVEQVISSIGMTKMELPMPIPQIEEAVDEIDNVLTKYELDKLEIDISKMFKVKMDFDGDEKDGDDDDKNSDDDEKEAAKNPMKESSKKILDAVKKSGKRWEIVKELWDAKKASPFSFSPLVGKVEDTEAGEGVVYLVVAMAPATSDNNDGMQIQMMAPPTVVRMKLEKDKWLFDGRDEERTMKAMNEFMEKQGGMMGGGSEEQRHDF